jgi:hypothetical protein
VNPFGVPSDARLRLVIAAVVVGAIGVFSSLALSTVDLDRAVAACSTLAGRRSGTAANAAGFAQWNAAYLACYAPSAHSAALQMLEGLGLPFIAVGTYAVQIAWRTSRDDLKPLSGPLAQRVGTLSTAVGLRTPPHVMLDARPIKATHSVFGRSSAPILVVTPGLVNEYGRDPLSGDAIVLHELAHIANGDIRRQHFAIALRTALRTVGLVLIAAGIAVLVAQGGHASTVIGYVAHTVALLAVYQVALHAYVRRRELLADLRVTRWCANDTAQAQALRRPAAPGRRPARWRAVRAVRAVFDMHPPVPARLAGLGDPAQAMRFTGSAALLAGITAGMLAPLADTFLSLLFTGSRLSGDIDAMCGALAGCLLGTALAAGLARNAYLGAAAKTTGEPTARARAQAHPLVLACAAAAGVVLGGFLPFQIAANGFGWSADLQPDWRVLLLLLATLAGAASACAWGLRVAFGRHGAAAAAPLYTGALLAGAAAFGGALALVYGLSYRIGQWRNLPAASAELGNPHVAPATLPTTGAIAERYLAEALRTPVAYAVVVLLLLVLAWMRYRGRAPLPARFAAPALDSAHDGAITMPPATTETWRKYGNDQAAHGLEQQSPGQSR